MIKLGGLIDLKPVNEIPTTLSEGFSTWEVKFARKRINKVELDNLNDPYGTPKVKLNWDFPKENFLYLEK